jgi:hypothetical protein
MVSQPLRQTKALRQNDQAFRMDLKGSQLKKDHVLPVRAKASLEGAFMPCACTIPEFIIFENPLQILREANQKQKGRIVAPERIALSSFLVTGLCSESQGVHTDIPGGHHTKITCTLEISNCSVVAEMFNNMVLNTENTEDPIIVSPNHNIKEFPYYSNIKHTSVIKLFRAKEEIRHKTFWLRDSSILPVANSMYRPTSVGKTVVKKTSRELIGLKYAATNYLEDQLEITNPLILLPNKQEQAKKSLCYACQVIYPAVFERAQLLGQFYVPHYNPALLKRDCDTQWKVVANVEMKTVMSMHNIYSTPRITSYIVHSGWNFPDPGDFLKVPMIYLPDIRNEEVTEDIPDQIQDFNEIKLLLARNTNQNKCNIWFDVFKRTLIRLRPTYPCWDYVLSLTVPEVTIEPTFLYDIKTYVDSDICETKEATLSLTNFLFNIAAIDIIEVKETCKTFTSISEIQIKPKSFQKKISMSYSIEVFIPQCCDIVRSYGGASSYLTAGYRQFATSSVAFPNRLYSVAENCFFEVVGQLGSTQGLLKSAFSRLVCLHSVANHFESLLLNSVARLPHYQFVQDVEDWPDMLLVSTEAGETAVASQVDSLWFFALDTSSRLNQQEQSNFLLFLPDPESVDRLGQEALPTEVDVVVDPSHLRTELLNGLRDTISSQQNPNEHMQERREVAFKLEENSRLSRQQKVKTIYYGRDRSKSRARLKDVPLGRNASFRTSEAEVMRNLAKSVTESRDILTRRRAIGQYPASPMVFRREDEYLSPSLSRRANINEEPVMVTSPRLSRHEKEELMAEYRSPQPIRTQRRQPELERYRQDSYSSKKLELESPTTGGLYGIFNKAQNIFKGSSTKERSPRAGMHRNQNF